jgi:hypothetical protein
MAGATLERIENGEVIFTDGSTAPVPPDYRVEFHPDAVLHEDDSPIAPHYALYATWKPDQRHFSPIFVGITRDSWDWHVKNLARHRQWWEGQHGRN